MYLDYTIFAKLYSEAKDYSDADMYIAERGWQEWMDDFCAEEVVKILNATYRIGDMSIEEMRKKLGYSRAEMSKEYRIPIRTLENWDAGKRNPPEYVTSLIAYTVFVGNKYESD